MAEAKLISIVPSNITIDAFAISKISIIYNTSANIHVDLYSNQQLIVTRQLTMDGTDYQNWTNDLPYLLSWVCTQLSFTLV